MFWTSVAIVFALLAIGTFIAARKFPQGSSYHGRSPKTIMRLVSVGLFGLSALFILFATVYTQDVSEAKVIRAFSGQIKSVDTTAGVGFKAPWDRITTFDVRNQTVEYVDQGEGENVNGPEITVQTSDGGTAWLDLVVRYSIQPNKVGDIYREFRTQENFVKQVIENDVRSVVRNIPNQYSAQEFRKKRGEASGKIIKALEEEWKEIGVIAEAVDLRDIRYPEETEASLQRVQVATNNANEAKANLETAKIDAEKTRVEAQAQADADQIVRCGAKTIQVDEVINGQTTSVTRTVPLEGGECQNRLNEQVLMSKYIDMLEKRQGDTVFLLPQDGNQILQLPAPARP